MRKLPPYMGYCTVDQLERIGASKRHSRMSAVLGGAVDLIKDDLVAFVGIGSKNNLGPGAMAALMAG